VDARLLVQHKKTDEGSVTGIANSFFSQLKAQIDFLRERLPFIFFHEKDKSVRFAFSTANAGTSIADHPLVKDADVLHLHWTNSGFLSVEDITALLATGKPIVWTLHDMWAFTGGCHYSDDCTYFTAQCGNCFFLSDAGDNDISHKGWLRKSVMYAAAKNITFVPCSKWLGSVAAKSSLIKNFKIKPIPNPIDVDVFSPHDKIAMREHWGINPFAQIILFGAANINDRRKGISYLIDALHHLKNDYPQSVFMEVVIFGKNKHLDVKQLPFRTYEYSTINEEKELAELYSLADVFVTPSLEDNLPNTVMEAMACGTPVVAFNTGGLPEMVDHMHNGYLAKFKSSEDIAMGICEVINGGKTAIMRENARQKVLDNYTNATVAKQYIEVYQSALKG
jgi:glycosyltransferase involved in cell wall biosynthesis